MNQINTENELLKQLHSDILQCNKNKIVFLAGHFPLLYHKDGAIEGINKWGIFSPYTLRLACKAGKFAKKAGKEIKFVFFVDDHFYESDSKLNATKRSTMRNQLYKRLSGESARLPQEYQKIMQEYGFLEKDVIRQDHGKTGRRSCLYFSEKILRSAKRDIQNPCAREYIEFLKNQNYFNKTNSHIISFIPQRCKDNICSFALGKEINGLSASHVFMESLGACISEKEVYTIGRGVEYRKDI